MTQPIIGYWFCRSDMTSPNDPSTVWRRVEEES